MPWMGSMRVAARTGRPRALVSQAGVTSSTMTRRASGEFRGLSEAGGAAIAMMLWRSSRLSLLGLMSSRLLDRLLYQVEGEWHRSSCIISEAVWRSFLTIPRRCNPNSPRPDAPGIPSRFRFAVLPWSNCSAWLLISARTWQRSRR